eukprot:CAMPEP_0201660754 /NCGR_PEP_ID=MMETSP0494-20130426/3315_1 /ASSEMBLY_ACC=CAM_ASM_000839 /TAXON_ID=420259 /ORGANISM="Thalassiosira gravida, Strain GMp14c1" /LENGTH=602 /DNA_ID=CAMNT_0048138707 /DNA_START=116 /DNA_END=1924 /DNA_ORIENTATION=+
MNYPHQGNDDDAALNLISNLSLTDNNRRRDNAMGGPIAARPLTLTTTGSGAPTSATIMGAPPPPGLNILNQASNITQLNANNTSFDPSQATATGEELQSSSQPMMIPSFLIQPSMSLSKSPPQQQPSSSTLLLPNRLPSQISTQAPGSMSHVQQHRQHHQHQQQHQQQQRPVQQPQTAISSSSLQAALFQSNAPLSQNTIVSSSSLAAASAATMGSGVSSVQQLQQPVIPQMQQQQQTFHHSQPIMQHTQQLQQQQQLGYEKKEYYSDNSKKALMSGRVPATRRDGRKLFVGGLPNGVSDLSFLQFFQQYGEVIDSVVLLDRRTKRSRGFGFVTFADPNVAASLLTTIPGRTGMVNILGKNCEIKASEPKTAEAAHLAHSTINLPPPLHSSNPHHQHHPPPPSPQGWHPVSQHQQRVVFGDGGTGRVNPATMPVPLNFNYHRGGGAETTSTSGSHGGGSGPGMPIYSHSTITTAAVQPNIASSPDGNNASPAVYIQNNFYTLPPGADLPPSHASLSSANSPTPEGLVQAQQTELNQRGGAMAAALGHSAPYTTTFSSVQSLYPSSGSGEMDNIGGQLHQQQQQQQANTRGHHQSYTSLSRQH